MNNLIEITVRGPQFWSENDESAFFDRLGSIACIESVLGRGEDLILALETTRLSDADLRELLALFRRYEIPMGSLAAFDCERFASWFRDKRAYWYASVFGAS